MEIRNFSLSVEYYINTNELPNHFTLIVFWCERRDLLFSHSNSDIFIREDSTFSHESSLGISMVFIIIIRFDFL